MSWRTMKRVLTTGALLCVGLTGCSREVLSVAESDVVVTFREEGRDYGEYRTYLLPEDVVDLCPVDDDGFIGIGGAGLGGSENGLDPDRCKAADHSLDDTLLETLRENLEQLGYEEFDPADGGEPDVAFFLGVVAQDNWFVSSVPGYCYPGYYYYGCWYPGYTYAYNLPTNSYVIEMADVSETQGGDIANVWTAMLQGVAQASSERSGEQRMEDAVNQAFDQSPYLAGEQ